MKNWLTGLILALTICVYGQQHINIDKGWKFIQKDDVGAEKVNYHDDDWRQLNLPHDWSIEGEYKETHPMGDQCGYLPAGIGWYRKTINVPKEWKNKHVEIAFEGVFMNSTVWANGIKLGERPYGWISFAYDISTIVKNSETITFAVRVDNSKQPSARWYTGSGIYSHVWMDVKNPTHIVRDGVFVKTKENQVTITTELETYQNKKNQKTTLITSIEDAKGNRLVTNKQKTKVESQIVALQEVFTIQNPKMWSPESPYLYTLVSEVMVKGKIVDVVKTRFGLRDIQWKAATGMWLNGKNVKLQGVCNHQDAGALGAAVPDKIIRFRIQQLKDMGVNAIRTAHNPQTPIFYDLCDEMGMIVMDEIFDGWERKAPHDYGAHSFEEWWQKDVTDWIRRDRNHPSVFIYSVGNETKGEVAKDLVELCHYLDPTRPVTSGHSGSEHMDVFGVNGHSEKKGFFDHLEEESDGKVFIGTENTHTWQIRGFYRTQTWFRDGYPSERQKPYECPDLTQKEVFTHDWIDAAERSNEKQRFRSSYDNAMVRLTSRRNIQQIRDIPNHAGSFRWTGYDYIGEAKYQGGWPFKSFMGGAIDMANFEKDLFYLYQSQWTIKPMVHVLPHWTHPKVASGTEIPVWVYSNCDEVELFFNGTSLGKDIPGKNWDNMQCDWMVKWKPGTLKAVGYKNGKVVAEQIVRTADTPSKIELSVDGVNLEDKEGDLVQVRVTTQDAKGEMYPYGENRIYFHVVGSGKIKSLDNGSPVDVEQHVGPNHRKAFYGLTRAYIESTDSKGDISLVAACILGEKRLITSKKVSIDTDIINLRGQNIKADVKVFYTTNGDTPTTKSRQYTSSFEVELGTTVKALLVLNGKPIQVLEERFAADEGFTWNKNEKGIEIAGEQAEEATLYQAEITQKGSKYKGTGFVKLKHVKGAGVEWYYENDGGAGSANMFVRYSGIAKNAIGTFVKVIVNGKVVNEKLFLRNTRNHFKSWNKVKVPILLARGANTIKIETVETRGVGIDEIIIQ
ncbi:glycoside hydrolase family 2 TIM barrel-domain containing protein [Ochrovirga pacifica]|uniref:glycoside hydrolase family 2 TIM barrel-domain containing protein n=1 Tax=Ochrovirga pacifica TaxID=1042376 RepID=UPI0002559559|nr:glycoside hydrolase family 2 TIM barrel-domain containing protein [Ochrovirga pacifica]